MKDYNHLLAGKRVCITSGQRGIGKDIALLFARQGATIALGGPNAQRVNKTLLELISYAPGSRAYCMDLSNAAQTQAACNAIMADFGGIDILVSTVGINKHQPVHLCDDETIERFLETNYKSGLRCARTFLPGMLERCSGNIVNISSIHAMMTMPGFGIYAGTKGAMNATARAMALDYAPHGVRVNTICPGLILSDNMMDEIHTYPEGEARDEFMQTLSQMQPLPPGKMEDISNAALYLASDLSAYMTGQVLMVDGGASIRAH